MSDRSHLDSHADTTVAGPNMVMTEPDNVSRYVDFSPFSDEYPAMEKVPICTCATAYESNTGQVVILCFGEALYLGDRIQQSLLCPNQLRENRNLVQDVPMQYNSASPHGITLFSEDGERQLFIKLKMEGVFSYFDSRKPKAEELEACEYFWAISESTPWTPSSSQCAQAERS